MSWHNKLIRLDPAVDCYRLLTTIGDLPFSHAITGRAGGVSDGSCASLNISFVRGDTPEAVRENRRRLCDVLGIDPHRLIFQEQIHADSIAVVENPWIDQSSLEKGVFIAGTDALITTQRKLVIGSRGADCTLIGIGDTQTGAVAIIHAGWRSTAKGISARTVRKLLEVTNSSPDHLIAFFGPSAGPCCYEVGPEFIDIVRDSPWIHQQHLSRKEIETRDQQKGDTQIRLMLDLWQANVDQLKAEGLSAPHIVNPEICTICHHDAFYSYRVLGERVGGHALLMWRN